MTYKEALQAFKREVLPNLRLPKPPLQDKPAKRQAWVNYIDSLHRNKIITTEQADKWDNPF